VDRDEVERGFWIVREGTYVKSRVLIAELDGEVHPGRLYRFFFGMKEEEGRFRTLQNRVFLLRLRGEVVAQRGDRFLVLDSSGRLTASGKVLHPAVKTTRKDFIRGNLSDLMNRFEIYLVKEKLSEGVSKEEIARMTGRSADIGGSEEVVFIEGKYYFREHLLNLQRKLTDMLEHLNDPVPKAELLRKLSLNEELLNHIISSLEQWHLVEGFLVTIHPSGG